MPGIAVKIRAAGQEEAQVIGEPGVAGNRRRVVIGMERFEGVKARVSERREPRVNAGLPRMCH